MHIRHLLQALQVKKILIKTDCDFISLTWVKRFIYFLASLITVFIGACCWIDGFKLDSCLAVHDHLISVPEQWPDMSLFFCLYPWFKLKYLFLPYVITMYIKDFFTELVQVQSPDLIVLIFGTCSMVILLGSKASHSCKCKLGKYSSSLLLNWIQHVCQYYISL